MTTISRNVCDVCGSEWHENIITEVVLRYEQDRFMEPVDVTKHICPDCRSYDFEYDTTDLVYCIENQQVIGVVNLRNHEFIEMPENRRSMSTIHLFNDIEEKLL